MALQRTQKGLAKRIDQTYYQKSHPWRRTRKSLVFLCCLAAVLYIVFAMGTGRAQSIHNPGNLMPAHASFQNNCEKCHQGTGSSFSLVVTDEACLKCHDAAIHNQNQKNQVVLVNNVATRAASCVDCHVEHRGREVMMASADQYCTSCHANLGTGRGATIDGSTHGCPVHITDFTPEDHPHFGRELMKDGKMFDPTVLRFNHEKHLSGILKGEQANCTWCHTPGGGAISPSPGTPGEGGGGGLQSPSAIPIATAGFTSLRQVNYERNCRTCHDLGTIPGSNVPVPHAAMAQVRAAISTFETDRTAPWQDIQSDSNAQAINARMEDYLNEQTPLDVYKQQFQDDDAAIVAAVNKDPILLTTYSQSVPMPPDIYAKINAAITKAIPGTSKTVLTKRKKYLTPLSATTKPSPQFKISPSLLREIRHYVETKSPQSDQPDLLAALARFDPAPPDPRLMQFYLAEANGGVSCIMCHHLEGNPASVPGDWAAPRTFGSDSDTTAAKPAEWTTVPTGIPDGPRRWFANSQFNHDAHRSMGCVECHAAALTSTQTSDVLSPDFQWQGYNHEMTAVVSRSCFECHHAENSTGPGAKSNCTECHAYHDRSLEKPVESGAPPTTRPSVASAGP